jgi:hypothetical protein
MPVAGVFKSLTISTSGEVEREALGGVIKNLSA